MRCLSLHSAFCFWLSAFYGLPFGGCAWLFVWSPLFPGPPVPLSGVPWSWGPVVLWSGSFLVPGALVPPSFDSLVLWPGLWCRALVLWPHGPAAFWSPYPLSSGPPNSLVPWSSGSFLSMNLHHVQNEPSSTSATFLDGLQIGGVAVPRFVKREPVSSLIVNPHQLPHSATPCKWVRLPPPTPHSIYTRTSTMNRDSSLTSWQIPQWSANGGHETVLCSGMNPHP